MKKIYLLKTSYILVAFLINKQPNAQVGINPIGVTTNSSAILDVNSTSQCLLIPSVTLTSTSVSSPITSPAASLLICNTTTTCDVVIFQDIQWYTDTK